MNLSGFFRNDSRQSEQKNGLAPPRFSREGVDYSPTKRPIEAGWYVCPQNFGRDEDAVSFLAQLEEEGLAEAQEDGTILVSWPQVYFLLGSEAHSESFPLLGLPPLRETKPSLSSSGALSDSTFSVTIDGWRDQDGAYLAPALEINGAVAKLRETSFLLPEASWRTIESIRNLYAAPPVTRAPDENRRAWAQIRRHAVAAGADLSDFLCKTIVLTPERLRLGMRKAELSDNTVVELTPGFTGEPERWLEFFDRFSSIQRRYDIPDQNGMVQVLIEPAVANVLQEIKRLPGRRVAGARAEAFVHNPYALLGEDALQVIDEDEFLAERKKSGLLFQRFTAQATRQAEEMEVSLQIEAGSGDEAWTEFYRFPTPEALEKFCRRLKTRIEEKRQCCPWSGFDLEIDGDSENQLRLLEKALATWVEPAVRHAEVYDISRYSPRVEGIGIERPYSSPFIVRKDETGGWVPDNVAVGISFPNENGKTEAAILSGGQIEEVRQQIAHAETIGSSEITFPGNPNPIPLTEAKLLLADLDAATADLARGSFDPQSKEESRGERGKHLTLILKPNIEGVDYKEDRALLLSPPGDWNPELPRSLKQEVALKAHQTAGYRWLLHLWMRSPDRCRGALLADDMGLGKTLQILTFASFCLETDSALDPILVVAPVALLENWLEEIDKFFLADAIPVLSLYGNELGARRLSRDKIDEQLLNDGITRFLVPGWRDSARIILTTYETLRDYEFAFAEKQWSIMVCDEAQKIKNPNALVTKAAKKQNVRFRIACTGTPVENTLTDLWCLFDFIQPGLLGALNDFGQRYRRPIEAETDEEKQACNHLLELVKPQLLRRTKAEVARDLPRKFEDSSCRREMSDFQRALYAGAVERFRAQQQTEDKRQGIFGLLQQLRIICSDPRPMGERADMTLPLSEYQKRSPKMAWLIETLTEIKMKDEKVIIFVEVRELQRLLQHYIFQAFGLRPAIVNGDTPTATASRNRGKSRYQQIKTYQDSPGFQVIILSPLAVGFGLNIQAANHVIHYTRAWNPAKEDQATDRAYRIGQRRDVHVYCPIVSVPGFLTFDEKLDRLLCWKRTLAGNILNGTDDLSVADFGDIEGIDGAPLIDNKRLTDTDVALMTPVAFECFCTILWGKMGYRATKTQHVGDGGVDVVAIRGGQGVLIQCKTTAEDGGRIGWEGVRDVVGGEAAYRQKYRQVSSFAKMVITNQYFNEIAVFQARENGVELVDRDKIIEYLASYEITRRELECLLVA